MVNVTVTFLDGTQETWEYADSVVIRDGCLVITERRTAYGPNFDTTTIPLASIRSYKTES